MKTLKNIFLIALAATFAISCQDDDDRYNGSPEGRLNIVTLQGDITTTAQSALTDQEIDWTVDMRGRTFVDTVLVEATAISNSGRRFRSSVILEPGESTASGEINSPGGAIFDTTFKLYLSGIALQTVDPGIHYLIQSDTLYIPTGSSGIPAQDPTRLIVRLVWANASTANSLHLVVDKPDPQSTVNAANVGGTAKQHAILVNGTNQNSTALSTILGEYTFGVKAAALTTSPVDMPYRVIVVFPNGDTEVYSGVYNGLDLSSPVLPVLKVVKQVNPETAQNEFVTTNLIP